MLKRLKMLGAAAFAAVLMAAPAYAAPVIDFNNGMAGEGGTISWDGSNLFGSNIPIGAVAISGAPSGNGVYAVTGTASGQGGSNFGSLSFSTDPNNNFITLMGCVGALGVGGTNDCTPVTLLTGTFTNWTGGTDGLVTSSGTDIKNQALLDAINWPGTLPWDFLGFSVSTNGLTPDGTPGTVISTDIRNTAVPEPATMMLLGTGLLAAFRARRRQA